MDMQKETLLKIEKKATEEDIIGLIKKELPYNNV